MVMISIAGLYLMLDAQFVAIIQIVVYAGAIMVLFLFVIMLLNLSREEGGSFRIQKTAGGPSDLSSFPACGSHGDVVHGRWDGGSGG